MTTMSTLPSSLDAPLPSGGWTLYFHPAKETRWHLDTFKVVCHVKTYRDIGQLFSATTLSDWSRGKFFFTPESIPPLMENAKNIRGGSYSLRIEREMAGEIIQKYMLAAIIGKCVKSGDNLISCIRITPRRDFNIVQIWNRDCQKFSSPSDLYILDPKIPENEVKYMQHIDKKI